MRRLRAQGVGRIGCTVYGSPIVYPINYAVAGDAIVFRTRRGGELDAVADGEMVAFQIDGEDSLYHEGWSVLVVGRCIPVEDRAELDRLHDIPLTPWADGRRDRYVRIPLAAVSGRHISHQVTSPARGRTEPVAAPELRAEEGVEQRRALQAANDRARMDRDLHDRVIQRAFGVALHLSAVLDDVPPDAADRLKEMVAELDQVVADIRMTIFDLQSPSPFTHDLPR